LPAAADSAAATRTPGAAHPQVRVLVDADDSSGDARADTPPSTSSDVWLLLREGDTSCDSSHNDGEENRWAGSSH
jgi:hypothetical protein